MGVSIKRWVIVLLVAVLVLGAAPGLACEPVGSVPLERIDRNLDSTVGIDDGDRAPAGDFVLGVRGRPGGEPTASNGPSEAEMDVVALDWQLDEARVESTMNAQTQQKKSGWSDLSKTTKGWFIVGAVLIVGISIAALND